MSVLVIELINIGTSKVELAVICLNWSKPGKA